MPVLIILTMATSKEQFYFNASNIYKVAETEDGGSYILDTDGDSIKVLESPKTVDARIDKQIKNLIHNV